jgi:hypothetical protein
MKPTSNYKMSKSLKTSLALGRFKNEEQRHAWKRAMIGAELAEAVKFKPEKRNSKFTGSAE